MLNLILNMVKVISFSLWGNVQTYCVGCIKNVIIAKYLFPDWEVWIYYNQTVPKCVIKWLRSRSNVKLFKMDDTHTNNTYRKNGQQGSIWRYYPLIDENVELLMCRDTDSRLSYYEVVQIQRWIDEITSGVNVDVFSMIDQYEKKNRVVRAGTCAFRPNSRKIDFKGAMEKMFNNEKQLPFYCDENFLHYIIRNYFSERSPIQSKVRSVPRGVKDKIEKTKTCDLFTVFVGDVLDENNNVLNKYIDRNWNKRILNDDDDSIIKKCIEKDEEKMRIFMESI